MLEGGVEAPLDGKSNLLLHYREGKRTFPYVSAVAVLNGEVDAERSRTRWCSLARPRSARAKSSRHRSTLCLPGSRCRRPSPKTPARRDFVRRPEGGVGLETLAVIALGVLSIALVGRFGVAWGALAVPGVAIFWGGASALMSTAAPSCRRCFRPRRGRRARGHDMASRRSSASAPIRQAGKKPPHSA